jgi:hypothetical protein
MSNIELMRARPATTRRCANHAERTKTLTHQVRRPWLPQGPAIRVELPTLPKAVTAGLHGRFRTSRPGDSDSRPAVSENSDWARKRPLDLRNRGIWGSGVRARSEPGFEPVFVSLQQCLCGSPCKSAERGGCSQVRVVFSLGNLAAWFTCTWPSSDWRARFGCHGVRRAVPETVAAARISVHRTHSTAMIVASGLLKTTRPSLMRAGS